MFSWDSLLTLFQLLAVSVNPPPAAHSMRTCPDPSNDKNAVSARRNVLSENNSCSVNWSTRVAPYMLSPNYEKSWQSRLMMKTWAYFGFCVCLRLTHVLPHRLTSKPRICNPEKRVVPTVHALGTHLLPRLRCAPRQPSRWGWRGRRRRRWRRRRPAGWALAPSCWWSCWLRAKDWPVSSRASVVGTVPIPRRTRGFSSGALRQWTPADGPLIFPWLPHN